MESVLDRPLPLGFTTSFIFDTGGQPQVVEYTLPDLGFLLPAGRLLPGIRRGRLCRAGRHFPLRGQLHGFHRLVALPTALANTSIRSVASIWVGGPSAPTRSVKG